MRSYIWGWTAAGTTLGVFVFLATRRSEHVFLLSMAGASVGLIKDTERTNAVSEEKTTHPNGTVTVVERTNPVEHTQAASWGGSLVKGVSIYVFGGTVACAMLGVFVVGSLR